MLELLTVVAALGVPADVVTTQSLLDELADPRALARFPDPAYRLLQSSSYDRVSTSPDDPDGWFANDDNGKFLRVDERDGRREFVILDASGPGAVVRVWSPNPKGTLRVYFDGAAKPAIEAPMAEVLDGTAFFGAGRDAQRLAGERSRGWNLFEPMPFAHRCVITTDEGKGVYYQVNWRSFPADTAVETFDKPRGATQVDMPRPLEAPDVTLRPSPLARGGSRTIASANGPGAIEGIRFEVEPPEAAARVILEAEFDGERTVWCPLSVFDSVPSGRANVGWVMPFRSTARLSIRNVGDMEVLCDAVANTQPWEWDDRSMHFHATWRRAHDLHTRPFRDFRFVTVTGKGVFVGDALEVVNPVEAWWGEGDEKISVDNEPFPSHFGTGTEDYYGYGWCCPQLFEHPLHCQRECEGSADGTNWGRTRVARLRGLDAIPFTTSFAFDMEVWHWAECDISYSPATFWYALPGATCDVAPMPDEARLGRIEATARPPRFRLDGAIECESLAIAAKSAGLPTVTQDMRGFGARRWSDERQLWVQGRAPGDFVELVVPAEGAAPLRVLVHATKSWDYGVIRFSANGAPAGESADLFSGAAGRVEPCELDLGVVTPRHGQITIRAEVVGGNPDATGTRSFFGLDAVRLVPATP